MLKPVMSFGSKSGVHCTLRKLAPNGVSQGFGERCFAKPWKVFDQQMPACQQTSKNILNYVRLPTQGLVQRHSQGVDSRLMLAWRLVRAMGSAMASAGRLDSWWHLCDLTLIVHGDRV